MNQSFDDMLRKTSRENLHKIWQAAKTGELESLAGEEKQLAEIMLEHQDEFFNDFEFGDVTHEYNYDPETQKNPFLHITLHSIVENQLKQKDPIETYQFYNAMLRKKLSRHDTIHLISKLVIYFIHRTMRYGEPFDSDAYRSILKKCKNTKPEKVWESIDKEFERMFPG